MRLAQTPDTWRPRGKVFRHRSFDSLGYPTFSIGFGVVALGVSGAAWLQVLHRLRRSFGHVEMPVLAIAVVGTLFGIACLVFAARRLLVGHDGAIELDLETRTMLVLSDGASPQVLPYGHIQALTVITGDKHYTSGRQVRGAVLVALPAQIALMGASGDNMISRELAVGKMRSLGTKVATMLGVPLV